MGISPPTQKAPTYVTDSASSVAAPASAAFPPCCRILIPAAVAAGLPETTTPWLPTATLACLGWNCALVAWGHTQGPSERTARIKLILRIRAQLLLCLPNNWRTPGCCTRLSPVFLLNFVLATISTREP